MGFLFILVYLGIILAVIEISAVLFILTGLDCKVARFQVISMLTGTGFTTGESELIIDHPIRRKLGAFLILFGAFSLAVIISAISTLLTDNFFTLEIGYIAGGLVLLLLILKMPVVQKKLSSKLKDELVENYKLTDLPIADVMLTSENDEVSEISIKEDSPFTGKTFKEIIRNEDDLMVLFVKRGDIKIRLEAYDTELQPGDKAIIYGDRRTIENKFKGA